MPHLVENDRKRTSLGLGQNGIYHAHRRLCCHDAAEAETSLVQQTGILGFRALLTADQYQHHHIQYFPWMWNVTGGQDHLDDQQSAIRLHGFATMTENCQALVIVPIVQDVRQDVGIAA